MTVDADARAESVLFHELAGLLSSLWSISEVVTSRADHPGREEFISLLRGEVQKAVRAFKDLQNLRALMADNFAERIETVAATEVLEAADELGNRSDTGAVNAQLEGISLRVDAFALADIVARVRDLATEFGGSARESIGTETDTIDLVYECGSADQREELLTGVEHGDGRARALYVIRRIVARWGGDIRVEARDDVPVVIVRLPRSER